MDSKVRGVFATRSPSRPNPIGLSVVRLVKIEGNVLYIQDADIVDGTPLLDIKPYIPNLEERESVRVGWLEKKLPRFSISKDDGRFVG
jgi:tRNA-Thr(GGU) m(6)t(6)A37 methyltransferase TsaA